MMSLPKIFQSNWAITPPSIRHKSIPDLAIQIIQFCYRIAKLCVFQFLLFFEVRGTLQFSHWNYNKDFSLS